MGVCPLCLSATTTEGHWISLVGAATNIIFVVTKVLCVFHDKTCLLLQQRYACCDKHNFVFVMTKIIIVAAPANDNWMVLLCIITGFSFCLSSAVFPGLWTMSLHIMMVVFNQWLSATVTHGLFSVPSSVPTSKALLLCRLSQHPYHQPHPGLILHHGPAPRHPQEEMPNCGGLPSERDIALLLSHFDGVQEFLFWFSIHRTPLTTILAKSLSQTEWASPPVSRLPVTTSLHQSSCGLCCRGLWPELPQARKEARTSRLRSPWERGKKATEAEPFLMQWSMRMRMTTDDALEVHFGLRLLWDRAADQAYC